MTVNRLQAIAVVEHDAIAINTQGRGVHHLAVVGSLDAHMLRGGEVVSQVHLLVDLLAVVDVIAQVGECSLGAGVGLPREGLRP